MTKPSIQSLPSLATININGEILKTEQAMVSVYDRSYLYGDSLYEVSRTYRGKFFLLDGHLKRLEQSAKLCHLKIDQTLKHLYKEFYRTLDAYYKKPGAEKTEAYGRIILSRGVGKIGFGQNCVLTPTQYTIIVQPLDPPSQNLWQKGYRLKIVDRLRNHPQALDPAMKSGNYLNCVLAFMEAQKEGFDDALMVNHDHHLTEGTTFNLFYVKRGIVVTPPLDIGILDGLTRRLIIELCKKLDLPVRELRFPRERLLEADEVFLTSSIREVFPVTTIDQTRIGKRTLTGKPGPITKSLKREFQKLIF